MFFLYQPDFTRTAPKRQGPVIQPKLMKQSGQPVVMMHDILHRIMGKLLGFAVNISLPKSTPCYPLRESIGIVIPSNRIPVARATPELNHRKPSHLTPPGHNRAVQQSPLLEIPDQRSR